MTNAPKVPWQNVKRCAATSWIFALGMALIWGVASPNAGFGQVSSSDSLGLVERYRAARQQLVVRRQLSRQGGVELFPLQDLATPTDSLRPPMSEGPATATGEPTFPLRHVRPVRRLERDWFRERYRDVQWSFLGSTAEHTFLDTTRTRSLRARLQAEFGDPTQTLADSDAPLDSSKGDHGQFEYWFIVNDSIAVRITDSRGPRGRGLIFASDRNYRDRLRSLRDTLLAPIRRAERAPYVDYYYESQRKRWYRTGFDGKEFFLERISESEVLPGRRPRLDTVRTSEEVSKPEEEGSL